MDSGYRLLAAKYIRRQAKQLAEQFDGVRAAEDIEFVHRARVATRRLRAALRMFDDCFARKQRPAVAKGHSPNHRQVGQRPRPGRADRVSLRHPFGAEREGVFSGDFPDPGSSGARPRTAATQSGQGGGPPGGRRRLAGDAAGDASESCGRPRRRPKTCRPPRPTPKPGGTSSGNSTSCSGIRTAWPIPRTGSATTPCGLPPSGCGTPWRSPGPCIPAGSKRPSRRSSGCNRSWATFTTAMSGPSISTRLPRAARPHYGAVRPCRPVCPVAARNRLFAAGSAPASSGGFRATRGVLGRIGPAAVLGRLAVCWSRPLAAPIAMPPRCQPSAVGHARMPTIRLGRVPADAAGIVQADRHGRKPLLTAGS